MNRIIVWISSLRVKLFVLLVVRWLKKSSNKTMPRASICFWFWDGLEKIRSSNFEPFIFTLFSPRYTDHVIFLFKSLFSVATIKKSLNPNYFVFKLFSIHKKFQFLFWLMKFAASCSIESNTKKNFPMKLIMIACHHWIIISWSPYLSRGVGTWLRQYISSVWVQLSYC